MATTGKYEVEQIVMIVLIGGGIVIYPLALIVAVSSVFNWSTAILLLFMFVFLIGVNEKNIFLTLLYPISTLSVLVWDAIKKKRVSNKELDQNRT